MSFTNDVDDIITSTAMIRRKINRIDELVNVATSAHSNHHDATAIDILNQAQEELDKLELLK